MIYTSIMPDLALRDIKPAFLQLIDLLARYRLETLGRTGRVSIPWSVLTKIAPEHKLNHMFRALIDDGVVKSDNSTGAEFGYRLSSGTDPERVAEVFIQKTYEELNEYKSSLILGVVLRIRIEEHNHNKYVVNTTTNKRVKISGDAATVFSHLVQHANQPVPRDKLAGLLGRNGKRRLSAVLYTVRIKLALSLGASHDDVASMLPPYARGSVTLTIE